MSGEMTFRKWLHFTLIGFGFMVGCAPPVVSPLRQATPNPMAGIKCFEVRKPDLRMATVNGGSEQDYLASVGAVDPAEWSRIKNEIHGNFVNGVTEGASDYEVSAFEHRKDARFVVIPTVTNIDIGHFDRVRMKVVIANRSGKQIEEIEGFFGMASRPTFNPIHRSNFRANTRIIGKHVGYYLGERTYE